MNTIWQSQWTNSTVNVRTAAKDADSALARHQVAERTRYTVQVVIEELMSNSIKYAFEDDGEHPIELTMALDSTAVRVTLVDGGRPFDPSCDPETGLCRPVPRPTEGGMGIIMVRRMARSITYHRDQGSNVVRVDIATD